jgi:uncharacterized MAPEG superfamily protein
MQVHSASENTKGHTDGACGSCTRYTAATSAALHGTAFNLNADDLGSSSEHDTEPGCMQMDMHDSNACLMVPFAEAVAVAWAASTTARRSEPQAAHAEENGASRRVRRAQHAQQQAPHVQAALTFVLLLCMAALGAEEVDRNAHLLSNILLVSFYETKSTNWHQLHHDNACQGRNGARARKANKPYDMEGVEITHVAQQLHRESPVQYSKLLLQS